MGVRERLIDAQILYESGRREGALLSLLIAVAATSRKRYPRRKSGDRGAFTKFLAEERTRILPVTNFVVKFRGEMFTIEDLFYQFMRCELAHEASLPDDIQFVDGSQGQLSVEVKEDSVTFSVSWIKLLADIVCKAPENQAEFSER